MRLFGEFGFAPLRYAVRAPADMAANSYYFGIAPPANTSTPALISDVEGSHSDDEELDSAVRCFHVHNEHDPDDERPAAILWPYLMPERRSHTLIAAGAILNILFACLVSRGRFVNGFGAQTWLLLTPTVLVGIIAQQQAHYYAQAMRYQRILMWLYLAAGAIFLVVVTFSKSHIPGTEAGWGWIAKTTFILFAAVSAFVAVIHIFGTRIEGTTDRRARYLAYKMAQDAEDAEARSAGRAPRMIDRDAIRYWVGRRSVIHYQQAVLEFCTAMLITALVASTLLCGGGVLMWRLDAFQSSARTTDAAAALGASDTASGVSLSPGPVFPPKAS
jgi:hypothetical protein